MPRYEVCSARWPGRAVLALWLAAAAAAAACSVEKVSFIEAPVPIGGTISGLAGTGLVLTLNGGEELAVSGDGPFSFSTSLARGTSYSLAVKSQPKGPSQTCSIANGSGVAGLDEVRDVQVTCETVAFGVGGTVTGLAGEGLVLRLNGGEALSITADGAFAFASPVASGAAYSVEVAMQPALPTQGCLIERGTGTVGDGDVADIQISCTTRSFLIGGTVTGLTGTGLVLQNNGGDDLPVTAGGGFVFATPVPSGETFAVTVRTQPGGPQQTCAVMGGTGTVGGGDVTSVTVDCATNRFMVGGTISGLSGTVTLRNNGGDDLQLTANGAFAFATTVASGDPYAVTVHAQPTSPAQTCVVAAGTGSGTVTTADITSVVVTCTTNRYTIGGTLSGLAAGNSLTLRNNGGDNLTLSANGAFTFATTVPSGGTYAVTRAADPTSPIAQTCTVTNGAGMVGAANVTNVQVTCVTRTFTIGGTVSGLTGSGLVLRLNAAQSLSIPANGAFTFPTPIASGTAYSVTIQTQPAGDGCSVANGGGTVGAANVTTVEVKCGAWSPALFPINVPGGLGYGDAVLDGNGDLLVIAGQTHAVVRVSRTSGMLTTVATSIAMDAQYLFGLAYRPQNDRIYASTYDGRIFEITPTGTVTLLVATGYLDLNALAVAPASFGSFGGQLIGVTQTGRVFAVNPAGGGITTITLAGAPGTSDLVFAPNGTLYLSGNAGTIRTFTADGVVTPVISGIGIGDGITVTPDGGRLFVADSSTNTVWQYTLASGSLMAHGTAAINGGTAVGGLVAAPGNTLIVMTGSSSQTLVAFPY